jgi:hypothetical protein
VTIFVPICFGPLQLQYAVGLRGANMRLSSNPKTNGSAGYGKLEYCQLISE